MDLRHIALNEIEPQGRSITVSDRDVWENPAKEYHLSCRMVEPVVAEVFVLPQQDGCLIRGTIRGVVAMPCNRCMEETLVVLNQSFDEFEEYPSTAETEPEENDPVGLLDECVVTTEGGAPFLDLASLLWEEFSLALPVKPLCRPDCRGLCPECGKNLNEGACGCSRDSGDPRLAALRQLKVKHQG
ncbi:YceD family protein [Mailhella massiliensis]|uniref:YceD family protein n=1 Tax=Mailhella massiliensis TaxID=1903261 RepID=UPI0023558A12|nr:DUF177 domain-containing protein [Mailhella massiliensis]